MGFERAACVRELEASGGSVDGALARLITQGEEEQRQQQQARAPHHGDQSGREASFQTLWLLAVRHCVLLPGFACFEPNAFGWGLDMKAKAIFLGQSSWSSFQHQQPLKIPQAEAEAMRRREAEAEEAARRRAQLQACPSPRVRFLSWCTPCGA